MSDSSNLTIKWLPPGERPIFGHCSVCGEDVQASAIVSIDNPYVENDRIRYVSCPKCRSLFAVAGRFIEYTDDHGLDPAVWKHYIHVGAGIEFMVRPIERIRRARSFLDVGCGFGFTLDYFRHRGNMDLAGVEPSEYGKLGRDLLGLPIEVCYLRDAQSIAGRKFDIVFSSEVIEHVPNPLVFLRELKEYLGPEGVLVLTTPRAEFVSPDSPLTMVISALSPGLHKLLYSAEALDAALHRSGFSQVRVEAQFERLVAFASASPLDIQDLGTKAQKRYIGYLVERPSTADLDLDVRLGLRFRALKELVNAGRFHEAAPHAKDFASAMISAYGWDPLDATALRRRLANAKTLSQKATTAPFCLGPFLFYRAMMERGGGDPSRAAPIFALAEEVMTHDIVTALEYAQESASLAWLAVFEQGSAQLARGDRERALEIFDTIKRRSQDGQDPLFRAILTEEMRGRVDFERSIALLQMSRYAEAAEGFAGVLGCEAGETPMRAHAHTLLLEAIRELASRDNRLQRVARGSA